MPETSRISKERLFCQLALLGVAYGAAWYRHIAINRRAALGFAFSTIFQLGSLYLKSTSKERTYVNLFNVLSFALMADGVRNLDLPIQSKVLSGGLLGGAQLVIVNYPLPGEGRPLKKQKTQDDTVKEIPLKKQKTQDDTVKEIPQDDTVKEIPQDDTVNEILPEGYLQHLVKLEYFVTQGQNSELANNEVKVVRLNSLSHDDKDSFKSRFIRLVSCANQSNFKGSLIYLNKDPPTSHLKLYVLPSAIEGIYLCKNVLFLIGKDNKRITLLRYELDFDHYVIDLNTQNKIKYEYKNGILTLFIPLVKDTHSRGVRKGVVE